MQFGTLPVVLSAVTALSESRGHVQDRLLRLRRAFYFELNEILHKALLSPLPLMTRQLNWPQIRSMAELIRVCSWAHGSCLAGIIALQQ